MSLLTSAATKRGALVCGRVCHHSFGASGAIGFAFGLNPFGIRITSGWFAIEPEPAFGRAFEKGFELERGDFHGGNLLVSR